MQIEPHLVSLIFEGMEIIEAERSKGVVTEFKPGYTEGTEHEVTAIDKKVESFYLLKLANMYPNATVLGEESGTHAGSNGTVITVDPADGTEWLIRGIGGGVSSMIAVTGIGGIVSAYVGEVLTQSVFGYDWPKQPVMLYQPNREPVDLKRFVACNQRPRILLRDQVNKHSPAAQDLISCFSGVESSHYGTGSWFARLWRGEVDAVLHTPSHDTPWDRYPTWGICEQLGYDFCNYLPGAGWTKIDPPYPSKTRKRETELLIIPRVLLNMLTK